MQLTREVVLRCFDECTDESKLVTALNTIIEQFGQDAYQVILHVLTHLDLDPKEAQECWDAIIPHWKKMSTAMGREVSLRTAICDYFCSVHNALRNPKMVEIHIFEKAVKDSNYDSLTGLINRQGFDETLEREMARAKRYDTDLSLLFFDLDDFKKINDAYGHQAGDLVLQLVAEIIRQEKRAGDIAARYGGEEMVVILPQTNSLRALVLGERIREKVEATAIIHDGKAIRLTISGGLASFPGNASDGAGLLKCADDALYRAKGAGKNNISFFSTDKRRYLRIDFCSEIQVKELGFAGGPALLAESKNIGMGGLLFENNAPMKMGTRVQIQATIDNSPLLIIGTVVRVEAFGPDRYDIGVSISFQEMDRLAKNEISRYLIRQMKGGVPGGLLAEDEMGPA